MIHGINKVQDRGSRQLCGLVSPDGSFVWTPRSIQHRDNQYERIPRADVGEGVGAEADR